MATPAVVGAWLMKVIIFSNVNIPMASQDSSYFASKELCMKSAYALTAKPDKTGVNGYIRETAIMQIVATCHETGL